MGKSNKRKGEGQYAPLSYDILKSHAWRSLSGSAARLFLELHTRFNGSNNAKLTLSYAEAAEALGMGKATVQRAFRDLIDKGFIVLVKEGNWYQRRAHEWRITIKPVQKANGRDPATHDWIKYQAKTGRGSGLKQGGGSVVPFQNPSELTGTELKPVSRQKGQSMGS